MREKKKQKVSRCRIDGTRQGRQRGERKKGRDVVIPYPLDFTLPINASKSIHIEQTENEKLAFLLNLAFYTKVSDNEPKMER